MENPRIQTKFCIVSPTQVFHPAQLVVRHGRLVEVVEGRPHTPDIDLGETVLMPGLVNAHTHLEFSGLQEPFPAGENFPAWISQVVRYRSEQQYSAHDAERRATLREPHDQQSSLQRSLLSGLRSISNWHWTAGRYCNGSMDAQRLSRCRPIFGRGGKPMQRGCRGRTSHRISGEVWREHLQPVMFPRVFPFTELIGMTAERCAETGRVESSGACRPSIRSSRSIWGALPHAPYSLHFQRWFLCLDNCQHRRVWRCMWLRAARSCNGASTRRGRFEMSSSDSGYLHPRHLRRFYSALSCSHVSNTLCSFTATI